MVSLVRRRRLEADGALLRGAGEGLRRVPRLTEGRELVLEAIELGGGIITERDFRHVSYGSVWRIGEKNRKRVLRRLIGEGLIEVMGASPAVYRVTALGRLARRLRG